MIARLLDGGTTADGLPYLVMEHPLTRKTERHLADLTANEMPER